MFIQTPARLRQTEIIDAESASLPCRSDLTALRKPTMQIRRQQPAPIRARTAMPSLASFLKVSQVFKSQDEHTLH